MKIKFKNIIKKILRKQLVRATKTMSLFTNQVIIPLGPVVCKWHLSLIEPWFVFVVSKEVYIKNFYIAENFWKKVAPH